MARTTDAGTYDPDELAVAVVALEDGQSLSAVAVWLGRDRSGLFRALKALGYPTRPPRPDPVDRRRAVEDAIARIDLASRSELALQIRELRRRRRT